MSKKYLEDQIRKKKREEEEAQEEQDKPVIRKPGVRQQNTNRRPATATPQSQSTTNRTTGGYPQTYAMDTYNGDLEHDKYLYLMQNQHVGYTGDPEHDMQLAQQRQQYNDQRAQISRENSRNWFVGEGAMRIGQVLRNGFGAALGQTPDRGLDLLEQQQFFRYMEQMGNEAGDAELSKRGTAGIQASSDNIKNYLQDRENKAHANLARHAVDRLTGKEAIPDAGTYSGRLENQLMLNNPQIEDYYGMYQLATAAGDKESADRYLGYIQNLQGSNEKYAQEARDAFSAMAAPENGAWMMPRDWRSKTTQERADYWEEQQNRGIDAFRAGVMLQDQDLMNRATGYMGWAGQRLDNATANLIGEKEGPSAEYAYRYNQQELEQKKAEAEKNVEAKLAAWEEADRRWQERTAEGDYNPLDSNDPALDLDVAATRAKREYENAQAEVEIWKKAIDLEKGDEFARLEKQIPEQAKTSAEVQQQIEKGREAFLAHEKAAVDKTYPNGKISNRNAEETLAGYADEIALQGRSDLTKNGYSLALVQNKQGFGMTDDQKTVFFYLYAEDSEKAEEFAEACKKNAEDAYYASKSEAETSPLARVLKEFGAANMKLIGGLIPGSAVGEGLTKEANARTASVGAGREKYGVLNTGFLSGKLDEDIPLIGGKSLNDWTQLKSSMIMSGETAAAAKIALATGHPEAAAIIEAIGLYMQSGAAANDDYIQMKELGWDDDKAMTHALFAGLAEGVFEKVSLENLLDQNVSRGLVRNLLTQAGVEASEEVSTSIANHITDAVQSKIYGYDNDRERRAKEYMAQGLSYNEAYNKAHVDIMTDLLEDALGGFISGGLMTGGNYASMGLTTTTGKVVSGIRNTRDIYTGANLLGMGEDVNLHQRASEGAVNHTINDTTGGTTTAMQAYAEKNGLTLKDTGLSASVETTEQEKAAPEKVSRRGTRAVRSNVETVTNSIADKMYSKSENVEGRMAGAVEVYEQTVSEYGEGIKPVAKAALQNTVNKIVTEAGSRGNVTATAAFQERIGRIENTEARDIAQEALDFAVYNKTVRATQESERMEGSRHLAEMRERHMDAIRNAMTKAGEVDLDVTVKRQDGTEAKTSIVGFTPDGKSVELANGQTLSAEEWESSDVAADLDTKNAVSGMLRMDFGSDAGLVFKMLSVGTKAGTISDGYRWLMAASLAYEQGRNKSITRDEAIRRAVKSAIDAETVGKLYDMGRSLAEERARNNQRGVNKAKEDRAGKRPVGRIGSIDTSRIQGKLKNGSVSEEIRENMRYLNTIAKMAGVNLVWFESEVGPDGKYTDMSGMHDDGTIWIDINSGKDHVDDMSIAILGTMAHELTHFIEAFSPQMYREFREFCLQKIVEIKGSYWLERAVNAYETEQGLSKPKAEDEIVAQFCQDIFSQKESLQPVMNELKEKHPGIWKKIREFFMQFLENVRNKLLAQNGRRSGELAVWDQISDEVKRQIAQMWGEALADAAATHRVTGELGNNNATTQQQARAIQEKYVKDPQYLTEDALATLLGFVKNKQLRDSSYIPVRINTPKAIRDNIVAIGRIRLLPEFMLNEYREDRDMFMPVEKARQAMAPEWEKFKKSHGHNMEPSEVISCVVNLEDPISVLFDKVDNNYGAIINYEKATGGNGVAAVWIDFNDHKEPDDTNGYQTDNNRHNIYISCYPIDAAEVDKLLDKERSISINLRNKKSTSQVASGRHGPPVLTDPPFYNPSIQTEKPEVNSENEEIRKKYDSLTDSQKLNYDYNQRQTETGSQLRTLGQPGASGSPIKRSSYGVGKEIGGRLYLHEQYADDIIPSDVYEHAKQVLAETYPDFEYNCVEWGLKDNVVRFDAAPGFDTEREPVVGDFVRVFPDGKTEKNYTDYIWHHKWLWVKNDYKGFDVRQSWEWSKKWLSTISGKTYEVKGKQFNDKAKADGNGLSRWEKQLEEYGLEKDPAAHARNKTSVKFQLRSVPAVQPSSDAWQRGHDESWFVEQGYPLYRDVSAEQAAANQETGQDKRGGKHGTQIEGTTKTYNKIYDLLQKEHPNDWQNLRILDASSGLGYGTRMGRERGFNVTDIEPFPSENEYMFDKKTDDKKTWEKKAPDYTDYEKLEKMVQTGEIEPFDFIISNAVLNVIPQDTRDNLTVAMGNLLAPGGQMFVNVINKDYAGAMGSKPEIQYAPNGAPTGYVRTAEGDYTSTGNTTGRGHETFVWKSNSVQKVFSYPELTAYLQDALGPGYTVEPYKKFGMTAAMVTRKENTKKTEQAKENVSYQKRSSFQGNANVEEVRDLIAVHNMTEQNLRDVLELGGFPSPSIAIVKAANGHTNYGPISVVFGRDSIDPALDSRNKVYGADAWTPTAANAQVDTEVSYDVRHELDRKIYELSQKIAGGKFARSALFSGFLDDVTSMSREEILDRAARSEAALAAYLADRGETVEPVYKKNPVNTDRWGNRLLELINEVIRERGYEAQIYDLMNSGALVKANEELTGIVREALERQIEQNKHKVEPIRRNLQRRLDSLNDDRVEELLLNAWAYQNEGQRTEQEFDHSATVEAMKQKIDPEHRIDGLMEDKVQNTVKAWLRPQIEGLLGKKGIRNERDRFTASGSERSFAALHDAYTLENIVKAMNRSAARGSNTFGVTSGSLQSVTAPEYRSIDEIRENKNRLARVDDAKYKQVKADVETEISEITDAIYASKQSSDGYMSALDQISEALIAAARTNRTPTSIQNVFARETEYRLSKENAQRISELYRKAAALPTEYFEAKPQRAMGFDEVKAVILPSNMDHEIVQGLQDRGVPVMFFEAGNDTQRTEVLNSLDSAKFQKRSYDLPSDMELMENAAEALTEAGGEEYWNALLESAPELADDKAEIKSMAKAYREQSKKLAAAEERLAEAKRQLTTTNRKLNTRGIAGLSLDIMKALGASDAKNRGVAKQVTAILTEAYQNALDALDNGSEASEVNEIVYQGAIKAADILGKDATHSEKYGRSWTTTSLARYYGEEGAEALRDTVVSYVYNDFAVNRYRPGIQPTAADRITERVETRMQKKVDAATERAQTAEKANEKLQRDLDFYKTSGENAAAASSNLYQQLKEARAELKESAKLSEAERRAKQKRIDSLQAQLKTKRQEAQAWKNLAERNENLLRAALKSKNADIDALRVQLDRNASEAQKKQAALVRKLEQQAQRERDILAGKLKPLAMQRLLKAEREKAEKKVEERKDEVFRNYKERKAATELRSRIRNLTDEIKRKMTRPTDGAYVPAALYGSMAKLADVMDEVLAPASGTKAEARYQAVMDAIHELSNEYAAVKDLDDYAYASEFDEEIRGQIRELERVLTKDRTWIDEMTGDRKVLRDFTNDELQNIYNILHGINTAMKNATKLMSNSRYQSIFDAMGAIIEQQRSMKSRNRIGKKGQAYRTWRLNTLSTMRAAELMSGWDRSAALYQMVQAIEQGTVEADTWIMLYNKAMEALKTGKNEREYRLAMTKMLDYGVKDTKDGLPVKMTKMQAMQILMTAEREAHNDKVVHLQRGGATIRNAIDIQNGKGAAARSHHIEVTPELVQKIRDSLTAWDKEYIKTVREYFAKEIKATNEILYKLKHRVLQGEEYYIPYKVDKNYLETRLEGDAAMNMWVKTPGSTNALQIKAGQPVIIDGLDSMLSRHVKDTANYVGLALPIRDFSKVYNGQLSQGPDTVPVPVKDTINDNFGDTGLDILKNAVIDVQGLNRVGNYKNAVAEYLNKLQGAFVKSALLINPSVTIKQAASYIAAESVISHRALEVGNRPTGFEVDASRSPSLIAQLFLTPGGRTATRIFNEIDQHTSMHYVRRQGMSYTELADKAQHSGAISRTAGMIGANLEQSKAGHFVRKAGQVLDPTTWIQRMDVATTAALWVACKEQAKLDGKQVGSAEYWQRTTELYERCLRETQPMYDSLHRTNFQKDRTGILQFLFPFRTVPVQNHGQIASAFDAMLAAHSSGDKARLTEARKHFAKTVWAQTESAFIFSVMTALAAGLKRKTKKYRDEDEELTWNSVLDGILRDTAGVWVSNLLPLTGSELWSWGSKLADAWAGKSGYNFDTFSVGIVDLLNELDDSFTDFTKATGKLARGDIDFDAWADKGLDFLLDSAKIFGIPAPTIKTYYEGLKGNILDIAEGRFPALNDESWVRSTSTDAKRFVEALKEGNTTKAKNVLAGMKKNIRDANPGIKEDNLNSRVQNAINSYIHEQILSGGITEENSIRYMVEYGGKDEDDAYWAIQEWRAKELHAGEDGYKWTKYDGLMEDIDAGEKWDNIKRSSMLELTDHGVKPETVYQQITEHIRNRFKAGEISEDEAMEMMQAYSWKKDDKTKQYRRFTSSEAYFTLEKWKANAVDPGDSSWSQYDAMRDAIRAGGDGAEELQDLLDHDVSEASAYEEYGKAVKAMLTDGTISADEAQQLLLDNWKVKDSETKEYRKPTENEVWKKTREWAETAEHEGEADYSYSQYDQIDDAITAGQDIKGLVKELTDHGIKQEDVNSHIKSYLVDQYAKGGTSEDKLKNQLSRYCGIVSKDDVDKIVRDANCKKDFGVNYDDIGQTYRAGKITSAEVKKAYTKYGNMSSADADKKLRWYDLQKAHPDLTIDDDVANSFYDGTSKTREKGRESASAAGMSITQYVAAKNTLKKVKGEDTNGDGKADTTEVEYIKAIDKMNLTGRQKWALYYEKYSGANWKKIEKPKW